MSASAASPRAGQYTTTALDTSTVIDLYSGMNNPAATNLASTAQRMKALGDEKRLRIVLQLAGGERCVCDLMEDLGAAQSLLSFHLKTLKDAGLVNDRREGRWVHYSLSAEGITELEEFLRQLREAAASGPGSTSCCE
jgi:ArsR family transcriptional regulator, arsenate/arsenite/antimonite-responsive transcriptional repressor